MPNTYFDTAKITGQVNAIAPVIDSFEDQEFSEYSGDTGSASIVSSPVADGSYAARINAGENEIRSTSGLDNYPAQGDIWKFNTQIPTDGVPRFYWGIQDSSNYYYLEFDDPNGTLRFVKVDAGTSTTLDSVAVTFDTGAYSETEVEWRTNGRHLIEHFDSGGNSLATLDATDTTFTSGGVGWGEWSVGTITNGLVAYWEMNEGSGTSVGDTAPEGSVSDDGTIQGPSWDSSKSKTGGYSVKFDYTDDNIKFPNSSDLERIFSGGATFMVWGFEPSPAKVGQRRTVMNKDADNNGYRLEIRESPDNAIAFTDRVGGVYSETSSGVWSAGTWHHIAVVQDSNDGGTDPKIYLDATEVSVSTQSAGNFGSVNDPVYLGGWDGTSGNTVTDQSFGGWLDDARFYNRTLSASEIQSVYDNTV